MFRTAYLYWRWLRRKRLGVQRYIRVELPSFRAVSEQAAGDNFPVLTRVLVRTE